MADASWWARLAERAHQFLAGAARERQAGIQGPAIGITRPLGSGFIMRTVTLQRLRTSDEGTFGRVSLDGVWFDSLELPWRQNRPNVSSIPPGTYRVEWTHSPLFGRETYELQAVAARYGIRIHPGNYGGDEALGWSSDLKGCIALGLGCGSLLNRAGKPQRAVLSSKRAVAQFEDLLGREPFMLTIAPILGDLG